MHCTDSSTVVERSKFLAELQAENARIEAGPMRDAACNAGK
jgi:hypothetical protein